MSVITDDRGTLYRPITYEKEADFERTVVDLADSIFGPSTVYVNVKRKVSGGEIVTIADGYLVDMTEVGSPKLFVIENEIVSHDPFKHIRIQMLKFVTSFDEAKLTIRNFLMREIAGKPEKMERLEAGCRDCNARNVDAYLDKAVYGPFRRLVVIDEARDELHGVLEKINVNISVLELKTFISENGSRLHQFDTLYDEDQGSLDGEGRDKGLMAQDRAERRRRRAQSDTIVVPAKEEGFRRVFIGEDRWYAIRVGAAMKDRIKFIAAYQSKPVSAVTHIAEVQDIRPYKDSGKYVVIFNGPAQEIRHKKPKDPGVDPLSWTPNL